MKFQDNLKGKEKNL